MTRVVTRNGASDFLRGNLRLATRLGFPESLFAQAQVAELLWYEVGGDKINLP